MAEEENRWDNAGFSFQPPRYRSVRRQSEASEASRTSFEELHMGGKALPCRFEQNHPARKTPAESHMVLRVPLDARNR